MLEFNATFFIAMFSFVVFMIIMNAILYKPLERIVKERQDLIDKNHQKAQIAKEKHDILKQWQESTMMKAQKEASKTYQKILNEYKTQKETMLEFNKNLSKKEIEVASAELDGQVIEARYELKPEVKTLANIISSKVLGYETNIS